MKLMRVVCVAPLVSPFQGFLPTSNAPANDPGRYDYRKFMTDAEHDKFVLIPGRGAPCVKWRKTLNCDPTGPRDMMDDKDCNVVVGALESGYCECMDYLQA